VVLEPSCGGWQLVCQQTCRLGPSGPVGQRPDRLAGSGPGGLQGGGLVGCQAGGQAVTHLFFQLGVQDAKVQLFLVLYLNPSVSPLSQQGP
jgi:hypothetical protein